MQITLNQDEIEDAIKAHVMNQIVLADGMQIDIDLKAGRGENGFTATLDIRRAATFIKKNNVMRSMAVEALPEAAAEPVEETEAETPAEVEADPEPQPEPQPKRTRAKAAKAEEPEATEQEPELSTDLELKPEAEEVAGKPEVEPVGEAPEAPAPKPSIFQFNAKKPAAAE